jgi:hypothetical protein
VVFYRKRGIFVAVIRVEKTANYTVMANHHIRNKNLSLKAKGLMTLMLSLPPEWDYSVAGLAAICKEGATAVRGALKELEENRYLIRERKNSEKGYFVYEYTLYEIPDLSYTENVHTAEQHTDEGDTDQAYTADRQQLNTEQLNKKELKKEKVKKEKTNKEGVSVSMDAILGEIEDIELKQLYKDYIDMRKTIGSPISERGLSMLINRCARLANFDRALQKEMVEAAIINNWKSVYLPKETSEKENTSQYSKEGYDVLKNFYLD